MLLCLCGAVLITSLSGRHFGYSYAAPSPSQRSKILRSLIHGEPLIGGTHEKVEFRMVADRRVFEATFYINANDVLDGSEQSLYLPELVGNTPNPVPLAATRQ